MNCVTRRDMLLSSGMLLCIENIAKCNEPSSARRIATSSIPKTIEMIGVLGKPLCTLLSFVGEWIVDYDHYIKGDSLCLAIHAVDHVNVPQAVVFPNRLIEILLQTTGMDTKEVLKEVREGDKWTGMGFETAEIGWIPAAVYRLPGVVPWRDGRPEKVLSRLNCVRLNNIKPSD